MEKAKQVRKVIGLKVKAGVKAGGLGDELSRFMAWCKQNLGGEEEQQPVMNAASGVRG